VSCSGASRSMTGTHPYLLFQNFINIITILYFPFSPSFLFYPYRWLLSFRVALFLRCLVASAIPPHCLSPHFSFLQSRPFAPAPSHPYCLSCRLFFWRPSSLFMLDSGEVRSISFILPVLTVLVSLSFQPLLVSFFKLISNFY
jgi:hypothetical protein